jgi:hypothetical protein
VELTPIGGRDLRSQLERALADVLGGSWQLLDVQRRPGSITVDLGPPEGNRVRLRLTPRSAGQPSLAQGQRLAIGYTEDPGCWSLTDPSTPRDVRRRGLLACRALLGAERSLSVPSGPAPVPTGPATLFEAGALEAWLAPVLAVGSTLHDARLVDVYAAGAGSVGLTFARGGAVNRLLLRPRDEAPAYALTASLAVGYRAELGEGPADNRALADALVALLRQLEQRSPVHWVLPAAQAAPAPTSFNLALPAPCGQKCSFCTMQRWGAAGANVSNATVEALRAELRAAREAGADRLRLNGIEPLNSPVLFDLLDYARELGFDTVDLFSTCRPLADRAFAERFAAAMPERVHAYVPIYGATPQTHDAVTGTPGSFEAILAALRHLRELRQPGWRIACTTVLSRQNAHEIEAIRALGLRESDGQWGAHLPYPNSSFADDPYLDIALTLTEVARAVFTVEPAPPILAAGELPPCVILAREAELGRPLLTPGLLSITGSSAGTRYRESGMQHSAGGDGVSWSAATVRCPVSADCALADGCTRSVYALYAAAHGLDELRAVPGEAVQAHPNAQALRAALGSS